MDNVLNYNGKVPEETLSGSNSDAITLSHAVENVTNSSVGWGVTFKLVDCQFKFPGHLYRLTDPICYMRVNVTYSSDKEKLNEH